MTTGIYKIENLINHKVYIGQSVHIEKRWQEHCRLSSDSVIAKAIQKYGKENFSFQILKECTKEELDELEYEYIFQFNSLVPNGYNVMDGNLKGKVTSYVFLGKDEVDKIILDLISSDLTLLEIANKHNVTKRTVYYINSGAVHNNSELTYPLREVLDFSKKSFCIDCGKSISRGAKRCKECATKAQRKVLLPTRDELKELIRHKPFTQIGKDFGVSDNAVRKWCKTYELPYKSSEIKKFSDEEWLKI